MDRGRAAEKEGSVSECFCVRLGLHRTGDLIPIGSQYLRPSTTVEGHFTLKCDVREV